jgi:hypothetical protein
MSIDNLKPNTCAEAWSTTARRCERSSFEFTIFPFELLQRRVVRDQTTLRLLVEVHDYYVLSTADQGIRYRMLAPFNNNIEVSLLLEKF